MIRIGMCDDNLDIITSIKNILEKNIEEKKFNAKITIVTSNQKEIYDLIYKKELDVLFLDIDFKNLGKNGLEFAKDLRDINKDFYIIFLTGFQRYIHTSMSLKVFDYLIKPINNQLIEDVVLRLKEDFENENRLFLHLNKWISIRTNDILYIEKIGNKSQIVTNKLNEYSTSTLEVLLKQLPLNFRKCHRSYIVNENKILSIDKKDGYIYFSKDIRCPINSSFKI